VGTSQSHHISHGALCGTSLNNVSSNQTSLGQTEYIELALEVRVIQNGLATLFCLQLKIFENGCS
jgi:hypothetical protein